MSTDTARDLTKHALETGNGLYVDLIDPDPRTIDIKDIAWALSMTCRFGGHVARYYSVAEHAVLVALLLRDAGHPPLGQFYGLHHDDHEAFLCDLPTPLKNVMGDQYPKLRDGLDSAIAHVLGLNPAGFHTDEVPWADTVALRLEAYALKASGGQNPHWDRAWEKFNLFQVPLQLVPDEFNTRGPWSPNQAYRAYLALHAELSEAMREQSLPTRRSVPLPRTLPG